MPRPCGTRWREKCHDGPHAPRGGPPSGGRTPRLQPRQPRAHAGGLPRRARPGRRGPRVRRPADRRRAPGVRARPPRATGSRDRPRAWSRRWSSRSSTSSTSPPGRTPGPTSTTRRRRSTTRPGGCSPWPAAQTARDYDRPVDLAIETKHPTRYAGLVERRLVELLDSVRLGRRRLAGPGDELLAGRAHPDQEARPRPGGGAADRPAVLLADGHERARTPAGSPGRASTCSGRTPGWAAGCASGTAGSTSGR